MAGARVLLSGLLASAPRDATGALAAFTLAQLELDGAHDASAAARAFALALAHPSLPASLREQALARHVEALAQSGAHDAARLARDAYVAAYPSGRWRAAMIRWVPSE